MLERGSSLTNAASNLQARLDFITAGSIPSSFDGKLVSSKAKIVSLGSDRGMKRALALCNLTAAAGHQPIT